MYYSYFRNKGAAPKDVNNALTRVLLMLPLTGVSKIKRKEAWDSLTPAWRANLRYRKIELTKGK
jgi:hypothetical protein